MVWARSAIPTVMFLQLRRNKLMAQASSLPFRVQIQARPTLSATFKLTSAVGGANLPFTLGHGFRKGEVQAGANVVASIPDVQVAGKNWWPDGSLKFAVISGHATLTAGTPQTIALSTGTPTGGAILTTADLKATGVAAAVGGGAFGSASWSGTDWDAPFLTWISGPMMSSWIYRKPIGSDAHLVAWLEVRLFAGGAVEVLPWIENGYLMVASPTNKNATYSFTLGGTQRFSAAIDLPNHARTVLIFGSALSHWLGTDPEVTPKHDTEYMQATRLVPSYRANVASNAAIFTTLAQTYTPLQQGNYPSFMGEAGYHGSIGMLPEWDALYLTSQDARAYAGVVINGYSAGRYGLHYRDETASGSDAHRPIRFSSYPNLVVTEVGSGIADSGASSTNSYTPNASGTSPATWKNSHHPSAGFLAYLVTGRFYFMEQVQFTATLCFLKNGNLTRQASKGIFRSDVGANTTRGAGWAMRTLAQAACATPDDDATLRSEFLTSLEENVNYYHARYVAQQNNQFGFVTPYSDYTGGGDTKYFEASWMQDFFTAAFGYTKAMELGISASGSTKLDAFFVWKAKSIIGRLGQANVSNEYSYRDAAPYTVSVAPSDTPNFATGAGPWYADWGQIYTDTIGHANNEAGTNLRGGNFPDPTSYWGNLQPAIAYAVEHNVPGAVEAYNRMIGASNWSTLAVGWNSDPVWSVKPRNV
jgi:hypothetical protein